MNYSDEEAMVRVDIFKPSGKWYETFAMKRCDYNGGPTIMDVVEGSLLNAGMGNSYKGWTFVCLEPYHKHAYPLMLTDWKG
jgi:hypothetical protein